MSRQFLLAAVLSASLSLVTPQLVDKRFPWGSLPYKADTDTGARGPQSGYNICNSTTEGPQSLCQTAFLNSLDDFCLWGPPSPGRVVGDIEGEMVAWCTQPGHGGRVFVDGTITGVQFTKAPDYVQVVGFMDQTRMNMVAGDAGGEMDPHGADRRGNPIGGLVYSNAFTGSYVQVIEWHDFNGANIFCFKACNPARPNGPEICQHMYDTQGCGFNAPSNARAGVFESCASDSQNPPGSPNGLVVPASSLCSTFASTAIYGPSATVTVPIPGASTMSFSSISRPRSSASSSSHPSSSASASRSAAAASATGAAMKMDPNVATIAGIFVAILSAMVIV